MSTDPFSQLQRLELTRPRTRDDVVRLLDDVLALSRHLVAIRDTAGRELQTMRRNLDAARAYGRARKGR